MKRTYAKPEVVFESFSMSTNIAAGCEEKTKLQGPDACGWKPDRWVSGVIFVSEATGCETTPPSEYDSLCYDVPQANYNLFNS